MHKVELILRVYSVMTIALRPGQLWRLLSQLMSAQTTYRGVSKRP